MFYLPFTKFFTYINTHWQGQLTKRPKPLSPCPVPPPDGYRRRTWAASRPRRSWHVGAASWRPVSVTSTHPWYQWWQRRYRYPRWSWSWWKARRLPLKPLGRLPTKGRLTSCVPSSWVVRHRPPSGSGCRAPVVGLRNKRGGVSSGKRRTRGEGEQQKE